MEESLKDLASATTEVENSVELVFFFKKSSDDSCAPTHIPRKQINKLFDMQEHFAHYCNLLPILSFNIEKKWYESDQVLLITNTC